VIAYRRGSVPELIEENVSGFVVDTIEGAVAAIRRIKELDRVKVRAAFESRFTADRMARDYVGIYRQLLAAHGQPAKASHLNGRHSASQAVLQSRSPKLIGEREAQRIEPSKAAVFSSANIPER